jgi:glucoamylase
MLDRILRYRSVLVAVGLVAGGSLLPALRAPASPCTGPWVEARLAAKNVHEMTYEEWVEFLDDGMLDAYLDRNISPADGLPGAVVAAPLGAGHGAADYKRVWIRDQAKVMAAKVAEINDPRTPPWRRAELIKQVDDFVSFTKTVQTVDTRTGTAASGDNVGDALVSIRAEKLHENWGNPQNDGPALRARTAIRFMLELVKTPEGKALAEKIVSKVAGKSIIDRDIEYTMRHWSEKSYDVWEEELGWHLDVLGKQAAALISRGKLAKKMGEDAREFGQTAGKILGFIEELNFWNGRYLEATRGVPDGQGLGKLENLDIAPILMANDTNGLLKKLAPSSSRVLATAEALKSRFRKLYQKNRENFAGSDPDNGAIIDPELGVIIGRYTEDTWDGMHRGGKGYGWGIATLAMGELAFKARTAFVRAGEIKVDAENIRYLNDVLRSNGHGHVELEPGMTLAAGDRGGAFDAVTDALLKEGDAYMRRVKLHSHHSGEMNEGMLAANGEMAGPQNLTWNYAAAKTAMRARRESLAAFKGQEETDAELEIGSGSDG